MSVADVFNAVTDALPAALKDRCFFGSKNLPKNFTPPRIVWALARDTFAGPIGNGRTPKALWTRAAGVDVHLWGETHAAIEADDGLLNTFLSALYGQAHGSVEVREGIWVSEQDSATMVKGELYVVSLAILIPVLKPSPAQAKISAVAEACEVT